MNSDMLQFKSYPLNLSSNHTQVGKKPNISIIRSSIMLQFFHEKQGSTRTWGSPYSTLLQMSLNTFFFLLFLLILLFCAVLLGARTPSVFVLSRRWCFRFFHHDWGHLAGRGLAGRLSDFTFFVKPESLCLTPFSLHSVFIWTLVFYRTHWRNFWFRCWRVTVNVFKVSLKYYFPHLLHSFKLYFSAKAILSYLFEEKH